ncbi:hypothetical protein QN372_07795 [Undibacterium sp. RTI2.1]|uniref:hypothetical protein n=1 Tax=unclassified Undibacterium TaxID=2630295 RepID=UPI002B22965B|nr:MULTISPECIES: hypothetical protein [unclassified Undibacterium]MEB0030642.1 hypothetical protein [Undibacterium sp. RTI2.1]MEB0116582.1 hypothetical protein [Undibacterium sp. RTI2.2]
MFFIWATVQNNREIAQRRLIQPVLSAGKLVSSECTTFTRGSRGGAPKPILVMTYQYSASPHDISRYELTATKWFDTIEACAEFKKTNPINTKLWYEKNNPSKASMFETEHDSWGFLNGLLLATFFLICGLFHQKSLNKDFTVLVKKFKRRK